MDYPVILERDDNDTVLVSFVDFPEAHTFGHDPTDALARATDARATVTGRSSTNSRRHSRRSGNG